MTNIRPSQRNCPCEKSVLWSRTLPGSSICQTADSLHHNTTWFFIAPTKLAQPGCSSICERCQLVGRKERTANIQCLEDWGSRWKADVASRLLKSQKITTILCKGLSFRGERSGTLLHSQKQGTSELGSAMQIKHKKIEIRNEKLPDYPPPDQALDAKADFWFSEGHRRGSCYDFGSWVQ